MQISCAGVRIREESIEPPAREGLLLEEFCINGVYVDDVVMAKQLVPDA